MRKRPDAASAAIAVMMICISILASCATGGPAFTDAEVDYTMHYVLEKAEEQTVSDLFMKLNRFTEPMVPDEYYIMVRMRDTIPGMNGILNNWARQTSAYILGFYDSFREYSRNLVQSQTFTDPRALLGSGSSAAREKQGAAGPATANSSWPCQRASSREITAWALCPRPAEGLTRTPILMAR